MASERRCSVGWKFTQNANWSAKIPIENCGNIATHRAISTNGTLLNIVQVCEECARLAAPLKYEKDHYQGMLAGDPLWAIFPPIDEPEIEVLKANLKGWRDATNLLIDEKKRVETVAAEKFDAHTKAVADFLNELWAILVDPLDDGKRTVAETMEGLLNAARWAREKEHSEK